jgi:hypothetical protein
MRGRCTRPPSLPAPRLAPNRAAGTSNPLAKQPSAQTTKQKTRLHEHFCTNIKECCHRSDGIAVANIDADRCERHNRHWPRAPPQWQPSASTQRQASCRNPYIPGSKRLPRVRAKGNNHCGRWRAKCCAITFSGIAVLRFPRAPIQNRAAVDMAEQYDVDEKSGKRASPESATHVREAQAAHGQDRDSAARIRLGPK